MTKNNLPVILLKDLVLLPQSDVRIELNNKISKEIIELSKKNYKGNILVVTPLNNLEESPDTSDLPNIGVLSTISSKIDLPSGNSRIVLKGIKRLRILSYNPYPNNKDILISQVTTFPTVDYNIIEETALQRKLTELIEKYISINPYISNSILTKLKNMNNLEELTDIISAFLQLTTDKKLKLMLDYNRITRAKKLINNINIEIAVLNLENKIDAELNKDLDETQKKMLLKEKIKIIKEELGEVDSKQTFIDEINNYINNNNIPTNIIKRLNNELNRYSIQLDNSPEIGVIRNYIDTLKSIPFGKYTTEVTDLNKVKTYLDKTHYGLLEVKQRILEYVSVKLNNKKSHSPIICLIGPPGVGKTTFAESISKSLNKKFIKISLGGMSDPSELLGHRKTYIGSSPGKIINSLIKTEVMNPLILLDEVDKISKDIKGDPVNVLLDILDEKQNKTFTDYYIDEIVDLSEVTWILTANDKNEIPEVLKDRLEIIELNSYLEYEKIKIAIEHLIPLSLQINGLKKESIKFDNKVIGYIIKYYTQESGVRNLSRLIDKIIRKIILESKLNNIKIKEITITIDDIEKYLGYKKYIKKNKTISKIGYVKGLAYTPYGGEIIEIEVTSYDGREDFITSGHLGETLKESIAVSIGYIKSNLDKFNLPKDVFNKTLHINFREGTVPKEGPSAGTIITTAILSYLTKKEVNPTISSSGEITLLGDILPVGGLKEKSLAAINNGIKTIYLSSENKRDILTLDKEITSKINFIFIDNYIEMYEKIFKNV